MPDETQPGPTVSLTPDPAATTDPTAPASPAGRDAPDVPGYEVERELGRGGMGVVYLARQTALKRPVALKMIRAALATAADRARFRAEAEAVARLQHPGIVQVFEVGESPSGPFVALEYVAGGGLDQRLKREALDVAVAARLVEVLARAVHVAHTAGVVHRDLKPANVLLTEAGEPKVSDFGLAKFLDDAAPELTRDGAILGTPSYMAPEQAAGRAKDVGPAADVWALGAILYECLTGRPPFKGATVQETLSLVSGVDPVAPRQLRPGVPRDLETVALKCLRKEEAQRYVSAEALADDLRRFQAGEPIRARPVGAVEQAVKWTRRNPAVAALLAVVALAVVAAGVAAVLVNQQLTHDRDYARSKEREANDALDDFRRASEREREAAASSLLQHRTALYGRNVADAFRALRQHRSDEAAVALDACDADLRGFEWRMLRGYLGRSPVVLPGEHTAVALHPGGAVFASADPAGRVTVRDLRTFAVVRTHPMLDGRAARLVYDPTGRHLAAVGTGGLVVVAEADTGKELFRHAAQQGIENTAAFSHDGKALAHPDAKRRVRVVAVPDGKELLVSDDLGWSVNDVAFFRGGERLLAMGSSDDRIAVVDARTGKKLYAPGRSALAGLTFSCAADGVGKRFAVSDLAAHLCVFDQADGRLAWQVQMPGVDWAKHLKFSEDGGLLYAQRDNGGIWIYDAASGREIRVLNEPDSFFTANLEVDRTGDVILVAGSKGAKIWRLAEPPERYARTEKSPRAIRAAAFTPDGELRYRTGDGAFVRVRAATGEELGRTPADGAAFAQEAMSPDGSAFAGLSADGTVRLLAPATGRESGARVEPVPGGARVAFSPDGTLLAVGTTDGRVVVFAAGDGAVLARFEGGGKGIAGLSFSPDNRLLAAGPWRGGVSVWGLADGEQFVRAPVGDGRDCLPLFRPDGRHLALACADGIVRLVEVGSWREVTTLRGHENSVSLIAYGPDGKRLATYASKSVRLWDADTGQELLALPGVWPEYYGGLLFSPDGERFAVLQGRKILVFDGTR